jgi:hypothetical protein
LKTVKAIINFVLSLLAVAKWLPFLGKYKELVLVASAILSTIAGLVTKCESTSTNTPSQTTTPSPTPEPTPIRTPSPSPTPLPQEITIDRIPQAGWPFTVKFTAPFKYNTYLWVDKYRLQIMGHDNRDGFMIAPSVVLNTPGKRVLTVRDLQGNVLAEKAIEVRP